MNNTTPPFKRLIAEIIDKTILGTIFFMITIARGEPFSAFFLASTAQLVINIVMWRNSTTIGKKLLGIEVVDKETGMGVGFWKMFIRESFGKYISGLVFSIGFLMILFDKDNQGLHDKLIGSIVVDRM